MKHAVLWVEDGAYAEMAYMSSPLYVSGRYDLVIALSATEGLQQLTRADKQFDAIIVDIRLPPGNDEEFLRLYRQRGESRVASRLGLSLLNRVLKNGASEGVPEWHRRAEKFGVFTVEGRDELWDDLKRLGIKVYRQKTEMMDKYELLKIIEKIRRGDQTP